MNAKIEIGFKSAGIAIGKAAAKTYTFLKTSKDKLFKVMKEGAVPFKAVSVAGYSALSLFEIGWNIRRAAQMKGRFKTIPSFKVIASSGDLLGEAGKALLLVATKSPAFLNALKVASTVLGVTSIVFQVFGLAVNIWESISVRNQIREFDAAKVENPHLALSHLRKKNGERRMFRIISKKQSRLIKTLLQNEAPHSPKIVKAVKVIDKQARSVRALQIVKTVVNIIMVLGLVLLLVSPTPFAAIMLAGMGIAMGVSFATMIAAGVRNRLCNRQLKKIHA